jgi:hypothetical protein
MQSHLQGLGVEVLSCVAAREKPRVSNLASAGSKVGPVVHVVCEHCGEWARNRSRVGPKRYPHLTVGDIDGRCLERGDPDKRLGIEQYQCARDAVGEGFHIACQKFFDPSQPLVLGEQERAYGLSAIEVERSVDVVLLRPRDECADLVAGGGSAGLPLLEILLAAAGRCAVMVFM